MSSLLLTDCLNEIFENLEEDKTTLHSCLLVNRLWCEISVRILWRNIWLFKYSVPYEHRQKVTSAIINTLLICLPNESKEILHKNGIFIQAPISKLPLFNYAAFSKALSVNEIGQMINELFKNDTPIYPLSEIDRNCLVLKEVIKLFMDQIPSLNKLTYLPYSVPDNIVLFTYIPEGRNCLTDLSELHCSSSIHSEFFYQLSQTCHNLRSIAIEFRDEVVPNELKKLVSLQNNLKSLKLSAYGRNSWSRIIPALTKHSNTLTKLHIYGNGSSLPLSFISSFSNLQEIVIQMNFKELQYASFPKLQALKIYCSCSEPEYIAKFLEINGKNLEEFCMDVRNCAISSSIARFCPNLKRLFTILDNYEIDTLKDIFKSCQYLESIEICCGKGHLSEKEVLEAVALNSQKNFYELKIYPSSKSKLLPKDLESFFVSWKNRVPSRSLSLIIIKYFFMIVLKKIKKIWK